MRTVWRIFSHSSARAGGKTVPRWVGIAAVFVATLLGFETDAFATCVLMCSGSTPICDLTSMMCRACSSDVECLTILPGTVCVMSGPLQGQCLLSDGGTDAGSDAGDAASSDGATDSGQDGTGGMTDAEADGQPDAGQADGGSDASSDGPPGGSEGGADAGGDSPGASDGGTDASEQDAQDGSSTPGDSGNDGAPESGLDGAGNVDSSADSATDGVVRDGPPADDASISGGDTGAASDGTYDDRESNDANGADSTFQDLSESGVSGDGAPIAENSASEDTDPILEGGGCACRASPSQASPLGFLVALLGLALMVKRRSRQ